LKRFAQILVAALVVDQPVKELCGGTELMGRHDYIDASGVAKRTAVVGIGKLRKTCSFRCQLHC
jgi:hypothetical protein